MSDDKIDSIVKSVLEKFVGRAIIGKEKYGTTLDRDDLSKSEWLTHLQEELMDAAVYVERLMEDVEKRVNEKHEDLESVVKSLESKLAEKSEEIMRNLRKSLKRCENQ